jgi:hypothetical protein
MKNLLTLESFKIGSKVQCFDKDGYFIMKMCGYIESHLGNGHAIVKSFNGSYFSSVGVHNISHIEQIN